MKQTNINNILNKLHEQRGFDFTSYRMSMIERRVQKRIYATNCDGLDKYMEYIDNNSGELDNLIDVFTINVSRFFRNSMTFESFNKKVVPEIFQAKANENGNSLRIWSAGCSFGEEPYSVAITLNEYLKKEETSINLKIFATDIDKKALVRASKGVYNFESIKNIKYGILREYFTEKRDQFSLVPEIKKMVQFSFYDLLDKNRLAPPDSIFGGFDVVLCRNVLIYFEADAQKIIFNKLYKSLNKNGYLILGEAEVPLEEFKYKFKRENSYCKIYRKIG